MPVTVPITAARTSHLAHTASTSLSTSGRTMASMRSWLSEVMTSAATIPGSRTGTSETHTSIPTPPLELVSLTAQVMPAPPRSCTPTASPPSSSSRQASMRRFSSNGSPTCTLGRLAPSASLSLNPADARTLTPPMPSRPVDEPISTARLPGPDARPSVRRPVGITPRQNTLTSGLSA